LAVKKLVDNTTVMCRFEGCSTKYKTSQRREHEEQCSMQPVLCPNSELCGILTRATLQKHEEERCLYRMVVCHLCELPCSLDKLQSHLDCDCQEKIMECPNDCDMAMKRSALEEHLKEVCPKATVPCPFAPHGCITDLMRENLSSHLHNDMEYHLSLASAMILKQQNEMNQLREQVAAMPKPQTIMFWNDLTEKINHTLPHLYDLHSQHTLLFFCISFFLCFVFGFSLGVWLHLVGAAISYYNRAVWPKIERHTLNHRLVLTVVYYLMVFIVGKVLMKKVLKIRYYYV